MMIDNWESIPLPVCLIIKMLLNKQLNLFRNKTQTNGAYCPMQSAPKSHSKQDALVQDFIYDYFLTLDF